MEFKNVSIKNFRNFENISVKLHNKNVFFGLNDVGKTNFLYAVRYVFDKNIRKNNLIDSDFYQKNIDTQIEILFEVDISSNTNDDEKLRAKVKGALLSNQNSVFIKLIAKYDKTEMCATPVLFWGGDVKNLQEIKYRGYTYDLDKVFNVIYIDAYVDLYSLFKKNATVLLKNDDESDNEKLERIDEKIKSLNDDIASLSGIKKFEAQVSPTYNSFRDEQIEVTVKSELGVNGLYSNVVPYIKNSKTDVLYPTAGEGRKKLLVYSIYDILSKESDENKINLFLIEEPENHLHRTIQVALSKKIFLNKEYGYIFLTTHSAYILSEMDNVNLIRIYNDKEIDAKSSFYQVPTEYLNQKQRLNQGLSDAIFSNRILLVEGPSEQVLFEKVLSEINPYYQVNGINILTVGGFGFKPYLRILKQLNIFYIIKTDNDLRKCSNCTAYSVIGFSRLNDIIGKKLLPTTQVSGKTVPDKRNLYDNNKDTLDKIRKKYHVYLSRVSLEEDLDEVIHDEMVLYLPEANSDPVSYLQAAKKYNMIKLVEKLSNNDCKKIISHYNFECLGEILE